MQSHRPDQRQPELSAALRWRIRRFERLDSTQTWLTQRAREMDEGCCVVAATQAAGRGRQQRGWQSDPGGLYASFLLKPSGLQPGLPWALSWALLEALEAESGLSLALKAPNDLLAGGRKLAGMLIDGRVQGQLPQHYICGFGVNLNQRVFPEGLAAVSLQQLSGRVHDPEAVLWAVLEAFGRRYAQLQTPDFERAILAALGGRRVQIGYNEQAFTSFEEYWHAGAH